MTLDPYQIADKAVEAAMALVIWIGKKHMDQDEKKHADAQARIHALEIERVKPDELVRVEERLDEVVKTIADNHAEVLMAIVDNSSRRR